MILLRRLCGCSLAIFLCGSVTLAHGQSGAPSPSQSSAGSTQTDQPKRSTPDQQASADAIHEALLLYRKGDFDGAQQKYEQVLEKQPRCSDAYAGLARVYLKKKDVERAFEIVERGRVLAHSPAVRVALGEVLFRQGKIHEAEDVLSGVINEGHREPRAYLGLARVQWAISMNKSAQSMIETAHELGRIARLPSFG